MPADRLFTPLTIKQHTLKNRIGVAPMTRMSSAGSWKPLADRLLTFRISTRGVADPAVSLFAGRDEYQQMIRLLNPDWVDDLRNNRELPLRASEEANVAGTRQPLP